VSGERTTGYVASGGERIYYEVTGEGTPVVLCHGLGGNHAIWWQQVGPLSEHHRVVTWDQRGFGNSTRKTGVFGPGPAVDDLLVLLDELGLERTHLVGQSMGGWVALGTALAHGDRLRSLVLTDTPAGVRAPEINRLLAESVGRVSAARGPGSALPHPALGDRFVRQYPERAVLYQQISSFGDKAPDEEMFRRIGETSVELGELASLALPVTLVVGDDDRLVRPAAMAVLAEALGAELHVLAGCGHSPYFEDPAAWNEVVGGFLRAVDGA